MDGIKRQLPTLPAVQTSEVKTEELFLLQETLDRLVEEITTVESVKDTFNQVIADKANKDEKFKTEIIQYFDVFTKKVDRLLEKTTEEFNYVSYLNEKIRSNELSRQVTLLEQQLANEKDTLNLTVKKLEEVTDNLEGRQEQEYAVFSEKLEEIKQNIDERISSYNGIDEKLENNLNDFRKSNVAEINRTVRDVKVYMQKQQTDMNKSLLDITQKAFGEIKDKCVDFLKECSKEASKAAKHAVNSGKLEKKDIIVIVLCGLLILHEVLNIIPFLRG
ncbi:MAG: hypothetical protein J5647_03780 [Spirochaetaceae bacterium]|nr:hypothetical protein [Spirochaetaceae bacterium]